MAAAPVVIAGLNAGAKVTIAADLYPIFKSMQTLSVKNHWARLGAHNISSLSSGQFKSNVFSNEGGRLGTFGEYAMILPGCRALFHKTRAGEFHIHALERDARYGELEELEATTGLYRVQKIYGEWKQSLIADGQITKTTDNTVVISDQYTSIIEASKKSASVAPSTGLVASSTLENLGFDLHFTPGGQKIGGWRNLVKARNAATDPALNTSATQLANSMKTAVGIKGVKWISEGGGSGVLTQAMHILKSQNISFDNSGHTIFFANVTTNVAKAEKLAREIGLPVGRKAHSKTLLNPNQLLGSGLFGGFVTAYQHYRHEKKQTALKFGLDVFKEFGAHSAALGTIGLTGGVIGSGVAYAATSVGLGATITTVTAALAVSTSAFALPAGIVYGAVLAGAAMAPKVISGIDAIAQANSDKYRDFKGKHL